MSLVADIEENACVAHGDCQDLAPEVFRVHDIAIVVGTAPDELMLASAQACPSVAIRLTNSETGEQVYP